MPTAIGTLGSKDVAPIIASDSGVQYAAGYLFFVQAGKLMRNASTAAISN
jgi:hypothetical protein